jgi:hypothetical protein
VSEKGSVKPHAKSVDFTSRTVYHYAGREGLLCWTHPRQGKITRIPNILLYCDVKEIRDSDRVSLEEYGRISSHLLLREDIRRLRGKYRGKKLDGPVVLVTMNFSSNFFTGYTVASALLGDIGVILASTESRVTTPLHHLPRGKASFTRQQNTSVAGVFVFDRACGGHVFFRNPYAEPQMPHDVFPGLRFISLSRAAINDELVNLGNIMFWPVF